MKKLDGQRGFGVVEIIVLVVVLGLVGFGGWYVWQAQQKNSESPSSNNTQQTTPKTTKVFSDTRVPFTFEYPKDWTVKVDDSLKEGQQTPDQFSVTVAAPGTEFTEQPIGGEFITKGAQITIRSSKTQLTDIQDRFTGIYSRVQNKTTKTVAGIPAVEFDFAYESDPSVFTEFLKEGRQYSLDFYAEGEERTSTHFNEYESLVSSFSFK